LEPDTEKSMTDKERLDLVRWLIERYDERKASVAGRATTLLKANALLLAATTFLIDQLLSMSDTHQFNSSEKLILLISIILELLLLGLSTAIATSGMANIWKTSRQKHGPEVMRLYYYPRQTFEEFKTLSAFIDSFRIIDEKMLTEYSIGHLWVITNEYGERYKNLRRATRFLVLSIVPLILSILLILCKSLGYSIVIF
jgi:hypothetical protein